MFGGSKEDNSASSTDGKKSPKNSIDTDNEKVDGNISVPSGGGATPKDINRSSSTAEKRSGHGSPNNTTDLKKRRSSGVGARASNILAGAKASLGFAGGKGGDGAAGQSPLQKLGKQDPSLAVPQGQHNNAAGESLPGPNSTFKVGVWEDKNKKCRRTMEDTHAFLYNFLHTPAPAVETESNSKDESTKPSETEVAADQIIETDNGYFAVFDGHAGTFAADWCGKKLHLILEDIIRKNPNSPIPEVLDQTFTTADSQLDKLPVKNSGCTAAVAVMRWEDRVPSNQSQTGSQAIAPAIAAKTDDKSETPASTDKSPTEAATKLKKDASRHRVLYTANVGDARIVLCRAGKALRLSYDHKGSDENEEKRIAAAGGLIMNNRVNGVLAVTRALGDTYMKDLVTGHPYTTETVIQPDQDEFMIIACDGLWDVCDDQEAVDLVREVEDPVVASKMLVDHALSCYSTDNLSCMIVRFQKDALLERQNNRDSRIGVEGDPAIAAALANKAAVSEADKIVSDTKQKIAGGEAPALGVSASNEGKGHDPNVMAQEGEYVPSSIVGGVEEEPAQLDQDGTAQPNSEGKLGVEDLKLPPPPRNAG